MFFLYDSMGRIWIWKHDDDDNANEKYLYSIMYIKYIGQHLSSYSHTNITQKVCPLFFLYGTIIFIYEVLRWIFQLRNIDERDLTIYQ